MEEEDGSDPQNSKETTDSKLKQQQLPAWQPSLTPGTVLPTFFMVGIAFIPIGISLLYISSQVREVVTDYTECRSVDHPGQSCSDWNLNTTCVCEAVFSTLIGRELHSVATPALLCHKEPARRIQPPQYKGLWNAKLLLAGSLWHKE